MIQSFRQEARTNRDQFWLTDEQFSKIARHLPADARGKARADDRRVVSGIVHRLKSRGRIDAPPGYGPRKTHCNRNVRWAEKGVWAALFHALAQAGGGRDLFKSKREKDTMFKRLAFFEGTIAPGREVAFDAYIQERLAPLWTKFPGATRVEVLREVEAEEGSRHYPLVLQTTYPERDTIEKALASKARFESREMTKGLLAMFEGRIFHVVYKLDDHAPAA